LQCGKMDPGQTELPRSIRGWEDQGSPELSLDPSRIAI
jgi:hypothetical protein